MKTAIVGYPRIGAHRELKFASEQYFRGACTEAGIAGNCKGPSPRKFNTAERKRSGLDSVQDFFVL